MHYIIMKKVIYLSTLILILSSCNQEPEPQIIYSAQISGTPGLSFNGLGTAFQMKDTTKVIQDFIGNIPLDGNLLLTFGDQIKGIEVTVQKENELGELRLEVFINDFRADSASTTEPQGMITLSAGDIN